jgi:hypothetical protein
VSGNIRSTTRPRTRRTWEQIKATKRALRHKTQRLAAQQIEAARNLPVMVWRDGKWSEEGRGVNDSATQG